MKIFLLNLISHKLTKAAFVLVITALYSNMLFGQGYFYVINKGVTDDYYMSAPLGQIIMQEPMDDALSEVQNLPFAWNFYGKPVTGFKASDNGYITFDLASTVSTPSNVAIPNPSAPNNAIYAFWDNLELSNNPSFMTNTIKTYTVGSAPNRVFVIQWDVTPKGRLANANYMYFAIRLYEGGDFDILFQQLRTDVGFTVSGTAGCENEDGSLATMVEGSPSFKYTGGAYIKENVPVYTFKYGAILRYDITMQTLNLSDLAPVTKPVSIKGTVVNHGSDTIHSFSVEYQVDGGTPVPGLIENLKIPTNATYNFTHPVAWQPGNAGSFAEIKVTVTKINGSSDENPTDNSLTAKVFQNLGVRGNKMTLIELFSTSVCTYCPDGHYYMDSLMKKYPNVIGMTHHSGYRSDSMTIQESSDLAQELAPGAPYAAFDRILWPNSINIANAARPQWEGLVQQSLDYNAPVEIVVNKGKQESYDSLTHKLMISVDMKFNDYAIPGDLRLNVFVIEDSVTGTGPGYDQINGYNETPGHPYYKRGNPIVGYVHRHVVRAIPTGAWGFAGSIPHSPKPGNLVSWDIEYTVPWTYKPKDMSVIAFVSYYDGTRRNILNAAQQEHIITGVEDNADKSSSDFITVSPNPASDKVTMKFNIKNSGYARLTIINSLGVEVSRPIDGFIDSGTGLVDFDAKGLPEGAYFCRLQSGNVLLSGKFIIIR